MTILEQHADVAGADSDGSPPLGIAGGGRSSLASGSSSSSLPGVSGERSSKRSSKADSSPPPPLKRRGSTRSRDCLHQWLFAGLELTDQDTLLVLKLLLKCSDISNVCKGRDYCLAWTDRVVTEFFNQVSLISPGLRLRASG